MNQDENNTSKNLKKVSSKRTKTKNTRAVKKPAAKKKLTAGMITGRVFIVIGSTLGVLLLFLLSVLFILFKGPSKEAQRLFTLSANETSAMKWLPGLFLSGDDLDSILNPKVIEDSYRELPLTSYTNRELAADSLNDMEDSNENGPVEELSAYELVDIKGATFKGKMIIVRDPSKVAFVSIDSFGGVGMTLSKFYTKYNALACTNAGGFEDEGGKGKGGIPDGIVIRDGKIVYGEAGGVYNGFAGFDANHKLHVGRISGQEALNLGIVNGTCFAMGPTLIKDGVRQTGFVSGINPRTCIGQTADGTVLLAAIEGRLPDSLGATFEDLTDLMESYGAVNAANMDGGSSSGLYYGGERITRSCSVIGDRPIPTAIVVFSE